MKTSILIRSYQHDVGWLILALKSIQKNCTGFHEVVVIVPDYDLEYFTRFQTKHTRVETYPGNRHKPMMECMAQVCKADLWCPDADLILHTDSDCIFTKRTSPESFLRDGKPVLLVRTFDALRNHPPYCWRGPTERALAMTVTHETMARHPAVHWRELYPSFRSHIEHVHQTKFEQWALEGREEFPWPWAEFPALGFWAMKTMPDRYAFIDVSGMPEAQMERQYKDNLIQGWTHFDVSTPEGIRAVADQARRFEELTR